jgi:hypothetical protein
MISWLATCFKRQKDVELAISHVHPTHFFMLHLTVENGSVVKQGLYPIMGNGKSYR